MAVNLFVRVRFKLDLGWLNIEIRLRSGLKKMVSIVWLIP